MTEELLFLCEHAKECNNHPDFDGCSHAIPHPFDDDKPGGCTDPTCHGEPAVCKPYNINKKSAKQFAKFVTRRLLPTRIDYD